MGKVKSCKLYVWCMGKSSCGSIKMNASDDWTE